jgi:hypothetical protein
MKDQDNDKAAATGDSSDTIELGPVNRAARRAKASQDKRSARKTNRKAKMYVDDKLIATLEDVEFSVSATRNNDDDMLRLAEDLKILAANEHAVELPRYIEIEFVSFSVVTEDQLVDKNCRMKTI